VRKSSSHEIKSFGVILTDKNIVLNKKIIKMLIMIYLASASLNVALSKSSSDSMLRKSILRRKMKLSFEAKNRNEGSSKHFEVSEDST